MTGAFSPESQELLALFFLIPQVYRVAWTDVARLPFTQTCICKRSSNARGACDFQLRNLLRRGRWVRTDYLDIYQQYPERPLLSSIAFRWRITSLLNCQATRNNECASCRRQMIVFFVWSHHVWHSIDCEHFTYLSTPVFTDLSCLIPIQMWPIVTSTTPYS
jgi:hypothetical protein